MTIEKRWHKPITEDEFIKWVKALMSGRYEQGTGTLFQNDYNAEGIKIKDVELFCCLGVLCDVRDIPAGEWHKEGYWPIHVETQFPTYVPKTMYNLTEIRNASNAFPTDAKMGLLKWETVLSRMNDNGATFDDIAQFLTLHKKQILGEDCVSP